MKWEDRRGGETYCDLGMGLELSVSWEGLERLTLDAPKYNVYVLGRRMTRRSHDVPDGKLRAEEALRLWVQNLEAR